MGRPGGPDEANDRPEPERRPKTRRRARRAPAGEPICRVPAPQGAQGCRSCRRAGGGHARIYRLNEAGVMACATSSTPSGIGRSVATRSS